MPFPYYRCLLRVDRIIRRTSATPLSTVRNVLRASAMLLTMRRMVLLTSSFRRWSLCIVVSALRIHLSSRTPGEFRDPQWSGWAGCWEGGVGLLAGCLVGRYVPSRSSAAPSSSPVTGSDRSGRVLTSLAGQERSMPNVDSSVGPLLPDSQAV